jgi:hypothetical protein
MLSLSPRSHHRRQLTLRPAWGRVLVTCGLMAGLIGAASGSPAQFWGRDLPSLGTAIGRAWPLGAAIAQAQTTVSDEEIIRYARSVLQMEIYRTEAYTEIKDLLLTVNIDIKDVTLGCTESDLPGVPRRERRQVEDIMVTYCNQARDIVEVNGFTPERFNEITEAHREDEALAERIRAEMARQQEQEA